MATSAPLRLLTADEFLAVDFGPDLKAELDNGVIRMMAGGLQQNDRIRINLAAFLRTALRGSGCRPRGSDLAVRTHDGSIRYPDLSITCGRELPEDDRNQAGSDPRVIVEILSASTATHDRNIKVPEYQALPSVELIVLIDPDKERLHLFERAGRHPETWSEVIHVEPADLAIPGLGVTIPHAEIFARD